LNQRVTERMIEDPERAPIRHIFNAGSVRYHKITALARDAKKTGLPM
jgi:hypothetical protein